MPKTATVIEPQTPSSNLKRFNQRIGSYGWIADVKGYDDGRWWLEGLLIDVDGANVMGLGRLSALRSNRGSG